VQSWPTDLGEVADERRGEAVRAVTSISSK
jgi:hypothetical protein